MKRCAWLGEVATGDRLHANATGQFHAKTRDTTAKRVSKDQTILGFKNFRVSGYSKRVHDGEEKNVPVLANEYTIPISKSCTSRIPASFSSNRAK